MMNQQKGQAAMEFLMTYGWAILVVLLAIGALAAFGVFNLDKYAASTSGFEGQKMAAVNDGMVIDLTANSLSIALTNQVGTSVTLPETGTMITEASTICANPVVSATYKNATGGFSDVVNDVTIIRQGDTFVMTWNCDDVAGIESGQEFEATVTFDYTNIETGQARTMTGVVSGRYE